MYVSKSRLGTVTERFERFEICSSLFLFLFPFLFLHSAVFWQRGPRKLELSAKTRTASAKIMVPTDAENWDRTSSASSLAEFVVPVTARPSHLSQSFAACCFIAINHYFSSNKVPPSVSKERVRMHDFQHQLRSYSND